MANSELLGFLPDHWEQTTLGEVCVRGGGDIQTGPFGSQLHASDYVATGIPSIMPQNIGENRVIVDGIARITSDDAQRLARYLVQSGDIVYSRRGDVERRALIREAENGWLCGTGCLRVRFGHGVIDPAYASYYLGHPAVRQWIVRHAVGATMLNLNTSILAALPFSFPPLPEQRAIANILGALDDKIELNRQMNETLEAMAQALFKSWFVDFDPVRAKAAGRQPMGMDAATVALFPDEFENAELGQIPRGWPIKPLSDSIFLLGGGTPNTSEATYWNGHIPWFSVVDAPNDSDVFVIDTEKKITEVGLANSSAQILPTGTTIISARGTVGKCALVGRPMAMNQSCYGVRASEGRGDYHTYFTLRRLVSDLQRNSHGSVFATITRATFDSLRIAQPPVGLTVAYDRVVTPLISRILSNLQESDTLTTIRDTLLPKLLSGEVRVS